jgi:hypothetical protein
MFSCNIGNSGAIQPHQSENTGFCCETKTPFGALRTGAVPCDYADERRQGPGAQGGHHQGHDGQRAGTRSKVRTSFGTQSSVTWRH